MKQRCHLIYSTQVRPISNSYIESNTDYRWNNLLLTHAHLYNRPTMAFHIIQAVPVSSHGGRPQISQTEINLNKKTKDIN